MKTYLERYGIEAVKGHLRSGRRYFKAYGDYAGTGVCAFNAGRFVSDIGAHLLDFPFRKKDQNGWNLVQPPTEGELDAFLAARAAPADPAAEIDCLRDQIENLKIERAALRGALRPFASAAKSAEGEEAYVALRRTDASLVLCVGDLNKAAATLSTGNCPE